MKVKKTLVVGASPNEKRYAHTAVRKLIAAGHPTTAVGRRPGKIGNTEIVTGLPHLQDVDTITMYISAVHQPPLYDYLLGLHPKRIIFNPGSENAQLESMARVKKIEVVHGCTLVMLTTGTY